MGDPREVVLEVNIGEVNLGRGDERDNTEYKTVFHSYFVLIERKYELTWAEGSQTTSMTSPGPTPLVEDAAIRRTEMIVAAANMLFLGGLHQDC